MKKTLYRIPEEKKICGVCAGMSVYFGIDVTLVRLLWVLAAVFFAVLPAVIMYVVCVYIVPVEPPYIEADYFEKK